MHARMDAVETIPGKWKVLLKKIKTAWKELDHCDVRWRTGASDYKSIQKVKRIIEVDENDEDTERLNAESMVDAIVDLCLEQASEKGPRIDIEIFGIAELPKPRRLFRHVQRIILGDSDDAMESPNQAFVRQLMQHDKEKSAQLERMIIASTSLIENSAKLVLSNAEGVDKLAEFYAEAFDYMRDILEEHGDGTAAAAEARERHETFRMIVDKFGDEVISSRAKKRDKDADRGGPAKAAQALAETFEDAKSLLRKLLDDDDFRTLESFVEDADNLDDEQVFSWLRANKALFGRAAKHADEIKASKPGRAFLAKVMDLAKAVDAYNKAKNSSGSKSDEKGDDSQ